MASVNKVILVGNLGRDPEVKTFPDGGSICNVSLATVRKWKSKDGERQEETEWHRVTFQGGLADIAAQFLKKGAPIYVEGRIKTRKWKDKNGEDKYATEIIAESMQMLGKREESPEQERRAPARSAKKSGTSFDDMNDDIPF